MAGKAKALTEREYNIINEYFKTGVKINSYEKYCNKTGNPNRKTMAQRSQAFFDREGIQTAILKLETDAFEKTSITKQFVLGTVKEAIERSMQHAPVLDKNGDHVMVATPNGH